MSTTLKFYRCDICGNLAELIEASGVSMVCCGQDMTELVPNTVDASVEKHVPVVTKLDKCVCGCSCDCDCDCCIQVDVGSDPHPMTAEHHISFIVVECESGAKRKALAVGDAPSVKFCCCDDKAVAVYAYCNLHGLWKADVA